MGKDFVCCIDASLEGLGITMMRDIGVIGYASNKLEDHKRTCMTHELELVVVMLALKL